MSQRKVSVLVQVTFLALSINSKAIKL